MIYNNPNLIIKEIITMVTSRQKMMVSLLLALTVFLSFSFHSNQVNAAQTVVKECTGSGYTKTCKEYVVEKYNVYFSKSEVDRIIAEYNKVNKNNKNNQELIVDFITKSIKKGKVSPVSLGKLFYMVGYNNIIGDFQAAKAKNKGLRIQYDMYIPKTGPNIVTTKNYKRTFE
jgi:hypothetical protein